MKFGQFKQTGDYRKVPAGTHLGVVTGMVYLGLQPGSAMYPEPKHKVALIVSFPNELTDDGTQNLTVPQLYTSSMHKKSTLRRVCEALIGAPFKSDKDAQNFDAAEVVGKAALFSVVHKESGDKVFANIGGVLPLPKGMPVPPVLNKPVLFHQDLPADEFLLAYNELPDWLKKKWDERVPDEHAATDEVEV